MPIAPVQVVLNATNFQVDREKPGGRGPGSDAFENNDEAFIAHRDAIRQQLENVAQALEREPQIRVGFGKATLRRSMWAKSHRPTTALFRPERTPIVGGADLGQLIFELTPESARQVARDVARAEDRVSTRVDRRTNREENAPSRLRSETGALESISLWQASDRRRFSLDQALSWLTDPRSGGGYLVELFERPVSESDLDLLNPAKRSLHRSFRVGLTELGLGVVARYIAASPRGRSWILIRIEQSSAPPLVQLEVKDTGRLRTPREAHAPDLSRERHEKLLGFLDQHPLVRRIRLQPRPRRSESTSLTPGATPHALVQPAGEQTYPKVGVIDGGLAAPLASWVRTRWDVLAETHLDLEHGTFIGGLLVAGRSLNPHSIPAEPDGCELVDVALLPAENQPDAFSQYYPNGLADFLDEMEAAISQLRQQYGTRIFNFSINVQGESADPDGYSSVAERLDAIGDATDSIIVISAGNLDAAEARAEWPHDPVAALRTLAAARNDKLLVPAESIRHVSVAAVNPQAVVGCIPHALANYSRRGPGLRTGLKPDFCHVGGAGHSNPGSHSGLSSILPSGMTCHGCGTSYAAPLVAKTLAAIDHAIEGEVSRETLLALAVHHASVPSPLQAEVLNGLARELVGFGMPALAETMLQGDESQITLVFAGRLEQDKQLVFPFTWPTVLTDEAGRCRGFARLTLVSHPPLDYRFGAELVRVNVDARLQQETAEGKFQGRLHETYLPTSADEALYESELIEQGFKWSPVKTYSANMPRGKGKSSNWRLVVESLTRANEAFPSGGVPFSVILTIADPLGSEPVFNTMRQSLQSLGVQIADIRTATRVVARV